MIRRSLLILALAVLTACTSSATDAGALLDSICETDSDCPSGLRCTLGICVGAPAASLSVDLVFVPTGRSDLQLQLVKGVQVPESGELSAYQLQAPADVRGRVRLVDAGGVEIGTLSARSIVEFRPRFTIPGRSGNVAIETNADGLFASALADGFAAPIQLTPGTYDVLVSLVDFDALTTSFSGVDIEDGAELTFDVLATSALRQVSGRVLLVRGAQRPLANATVSATFPDGRYTESRTDSTGVFVLNIPPDALALQLNVTASSDDEESFRVAFREEPLPEPGEQLQLRIPGGDVVPLPYRVESDAGAVIVDTEVFARSSLEPSSSLPGQPGVESGQRDIRSAPDATRGEGVLDALIGDATINVAPLDGQHGLSLISSTPIAEENELRVLTVPSRSLIQTNVTTREGAPVEGVTVDARLVELGPSASPPIVPFDLYGASAVSGADGGIAVELQPGLYSVRLQPSSTLDGLALSRVFWRVDQSGSLTGESQLSFGQAVVGRVLDPDGAPLPGTQVEAWNTAFAPYAPVAVATSDANGAFRLLLPVSEAD